MSHDSYPECELCRKRQAALLCDGNVSLTHGRSNLLHCALQTRPWSTEAAVCSTVRLQCLPTTSTRNCNCETFPQFSARLGDCPDNNGETAMNTSTTPRGAKVQSSPTKTYPQTSARFPSIIDQDTTLSMSSCCRGKDDYNREERSKSGLVLSGLLTLRHNQLHSDGVPPSCVSIPGCNQALLSTSFQSESHPVPRGPSDQRVQLLNDKQGTILLTTKLPTLHTWRSANQVKRRPTPRMEHVLSVSKRPEALRHLKVTVSACSKT